MINLLTSIGIKALDCMADWLCSLNFIWWVIHEVASYTPFL